MIQQPPFSSAPAQLETNDSSVEDFLSDEEFDAPEVAETPRTVVARKSKLSEEEIRLGEEALRNALTELDALGKTADEVASDRAEKDRPVSSEIEAPRRSDEQHDEQHDEQQIEEADNHWQITHEQPREAQTPDLGTETPQPAEPEYEHAKEEATLNGHDLSHEPLRTESPTSESDLSEVPGQAPWAKFDELQGDGFTAVVPAPLAGTAAEGSSAEFDLPADLISRLNSDSQSERSSALSDVSRLGGEPAFGIIAKAFDEESEEVRNAAARALFDLQPDRAASFARTLREASPERRLRIGAALATSGLAGTAIGNLAGQTREEGYEAFSLLFLMTKAGEVEPLLRAVEDHPNIEVRLTVVKLLALNGRADIIPSFRRLAVSAVLPAEVRAAVIEAIYELGRQIPRQLSSGAKG